MSWLTALADAERDGEPCVLVTVVRTAGSAPRDAGAKMVVTADAQSDTIGGGALEHRCTAYARGILGGAEPVMRDFPLGPALGQCCGGHVSVLFEPLAPPWRIALFGAGHVGQAVARVLATCRAGSTGSILGRTSFPKACLRTFMRVRPSTPRRGSRTCRPAPRSS